MCLKPVVAVAIAQRVRIAVRYSGEDVALPRMASIHEGAGGLAPPSRCFSSGSFIRYAACQSCVRTPCGRRAGEDDTADWITATRQSARGWNEASSLPLQVEASVRGEDGPQAGAGRVSTFAVAGAIRRRGVAISAAAPRQTLLVANGRNLRVGCHVAAPVPAAAEVRRELRGAKLPRPRDDPGSFSIPSADDATLEVRGTHAER
jgi:hypothetical protein